MWILGLKGLKTNQDYTTVSETIFDITPRLKIDFILGVGFQNF